MMPQPLTDERRAQLAAYRPMRAHLPSHWRELWVEANGARHHLWRTGNADTAGAKPAVVLLHGHMCDGPTWSRVAKVLEADYDVYLPDARGHGLTEGDASAFATGDGPSLLVEDAAALIAALGLGRPVVIGHSMGGSTAAHLADRHPEAVGAVACEDAPWRSAGRGSPGDSPQYAAWLDGFIAWCERFKTLPFAEQLVEAAPHILPRAAKWDEEEYVSQVEALARCSLDMLHGGVASWKRMDETTIAGPVERITVPTLLLVAGRRSPMSPYADPDPAPRDGLRVERLDAGHFLHQEAFAPFVASLRVWLAEVA